MAREEINKPLKDWWAVGEYVSLVRLKSVAWWLSQASSPPRRPSKRFLLTPSPFIKQHINQYVRHVLIYYGARVSNVITCSR
jgi:hypothetical protein